MDSQTESKSLELVENYRVLAADNKLEFTEMVLACAGIYLAAGAAPDPDRGRSEGGEYEGCARYREALRSGCGRGDRSSGEVLEYDPFCALLKNRLVQIAEK